jgi:hypothetical protein
VGDGVELRARLLPALLSQSPNQLGWVMKFRMSKLKSLLQGSLPKMTVQLSHADNCQRSPSNALILRAFKRFATVPLIC